MSEARGVKTRIVLTILVFSFFSSLIVSQMDDIFSLCYLQSWYIALKNFCISVLAFGSCGVSFYIFAQEKGWRSSGSYKAAGFLSGILCGMIILALQQLMAGGFNWTGILLGGILGGGVLGSMCSVAFFSFVVDTNKSDRCFAYFYWAAFLIPAVLSESMCFFLA